MTGPHRQVRWLAVVLMLALVLVVTSSWRGFRELLRDEPIWTRTVSTGDAVQIGGASVTVTSAEFGDSERFDIGRIDDQAQQILRVSSLYLPTQTSDDVEYCAAALDVTVGDISSSHRPRFSASEVACDGTDPAAQQSEFYFILPAGEVAEATFYLQVGEDSFRWLAVEIA
ncbi:hypothetical protein [Propionimicrobium sp. PCR01-08-3]|uniref:hypothetical protein n=1 Tax=Propionimicrobium sp. PCR01-08-3 TaxID=3052086 RepID=UPI00255C70B9|nr:hypothetical protein [Propionimicrobium sp. PCR01-08-3]WIY81934.1 hypothetical protein QQ658_10470 [Propionimicrobium sp. PCR01-08-3]